MHSRGKSTVEVILRDLSMLSTATLFYLRSDIAWYLLKPLTSYLGRVLDKPFNVCLEVRITFLSAV